MRIPLVVVCGAVSIFSQVTTPPGFITTLDGEKQFGSQPGTAEP